MDLEQYTRELLKGKIPRKDAIAKLIEIVKSRALAEALVIEIDNSGQISDPFIKEIAEHTQSSVNARDASVGCRGEGDFFIHESLARVIGKTGAFIDSTNQDDGGVVQVLGNYLAVAVDGMHSRLSSYPFLGGFHATRAALRDVVVMGADPVALFSDIHLANDGDVSKIFDYTAGICTVGEMLDVPLVSGSTLRVGGDMVLGDRITGCVGAMGIGTHITARKGAVPGDVIILTRGSGGGTIATTAIYNNHHEIVKETLNLDFLSSTIPLIRSECLANVHTLTDVTNGGIRGDAHQISLSANVRIELDHGALERSVNPKVLEMLDTLKIDFMGVSTDSLMVICPEMRSEAVIKVLSQNGADCEVAGMVLEGEGIYLSKNGQLERMKPMFREAGYTPVKKAIGEAAPEDWDAMKALISRAVDDSTSKKEKVKEYIHSRSSAQLKNGKRNSHAKLN
jgi:hydrogenase expression/formation protein